jgi:tRNA threonylcarbamoyl adenosine modification protein YeaZ/ribosomal-protein-alanine acetyltransferase
VITLAIDTSTSRTAVAITDGGVVLYEAHHDDALAHGEVLPGLVESALATHPKIDQVVVGMGPGPFTGLRVGIVFAQSFALARKIPWHGICSLDAIAARFSEKEFVVTTDARRKEVFAAHYVDGKRLASPIVCAPSQIENMKLPIHGEYSQEYPDATSLATLAQGETFTEPIYVRRPDAYPAPAGVKFRPLNAMDLVSVYAIEKAAYAEDPWSMAQFKEELAGKNRWYLVAELAGDVVGYVGGLTNGDAVDILTLTVSPEHRRKGIGRELLRRLIDWSRNKKVAAIMLEMRVGNVEALPLYLANGFVPLQERKNYYAPGVHATVMRKELS